MPKAYEATLYFGTGFDRGNVPDSPAVLQGMTSKNYDAVFLWQNMWAGTVKLNAEFDDVKEADYAKIGDAYYVIDSVKMLSPATSQLNLIMDPLTTAGGLSGIEILSGWASRAHVSNDTIFGNIAAEPWSPTQRLIIRNKKVGKPEGNANVYMDIVISSVDLSQSEIYATVLTSVAEDPEKAGYVAYPELPTNGGAITTINMQYAQEETGEYNRWTYTLPVGMRMFDASNEAVQKGITAIQSIGIESAIVASYHIPRAIIDQSDLNVDPLGRIYNISARLSNAVFDMPYAYASNVKNKKALALYNTYEVISATSGASETFDAHELYNHDTSPQFHLISDPSSTGTVYMQPKHYAGKKTAYLEHAVPGLPWLSSQIINHGASGSAMIMANAQRRAGYSADRFDRESMMYGKQQLANLVGGVFSAANAMEGVSTGGWTGKTTYDSAGNAYHGQYSYQAPGGFAGPLGTVAGTAWDFVMAGERYENSFANFRNQMGDNYFSAQTQANLAPPQISFPTTVNASAYYGNAFVLQQVTLGDNDLARFDDFLTRFGYAVDKALEKSDLNNRTKFNYIKTTDCQLKSPNVSAALCQGIADMFDAGVRIWHVAPSASAYDSNTIRGA